MDKSKISQWVRAATYLFKTNLFLSFVVIAMLLYARCAQAADEIRVMIIDTGADIEHSMLKGKITAIGDIKDDHGHGTHVTGLIIYGSLNKYEERKIPYTKALPLCPEIKIYICKFWTPKTEANAIRNGIECLKKALEKKVDYVNYSAGGSDFSQEEYDVLKKLDDAGIQVYAAAGNDGKSLEKSTYFPAGYAVDQDLEIDKKKIKTTGLKNIIVIGNLARDGNGNLNQAITSNYGLHDMSWAVGTERISLLPGEKFGKMTGTSQAVPIYLHRVLRNQCKLLKGESK